MVEEKRNFYRRTFAIAIPIMVQNAITNLVSMLDNIMVGRIGTDSMSGVAIVNQLFFVWYLCIFGGLAGVSIFTAQFYGKGDQEGIRYTFRIEVAAALVLSFVGFIIMKGLDSSLISLYLHADNGIGDADATFIYAKQYLMVMFAGMLPFAFSQVYASILKATGETALPMRASIIAVVVNLIGNYILIYGKFGAPAMGVVGAGAATVLARFVELGLLILNTHRNAHNYLFIEGVYSSIHVPVTLIRNCMVTGLPLLVNEALWSGGQAFLLRNFSIRGLSVVAAFNISQTIAEVFNVAFLAMGVATGIIMGQELGTGKKETLKRDAFRLTWFSVFLCMISGALLFSVSGIFPMIYNTSDDIRRLAAGFIRVAAICMPVFAYANSAYFIIRSGGRTFITFLFDSCFVWIVSVPLSWFLVSHTTMPIIPLYFTVQIMELVKCVIGYILVKKGVWIKDITVY